MKKSNTVVKGITFLLLCNLSAFAGRFSGTVVDSETQKPIPGALVSIGHTQTRTTSDSAGYFSFSTSATSARTVQAQQNRSMRVAWYGGRRVFDFSNAPQITSYELFNLSGRLVHRKELSDSRVVSPPNLAGNIYIIRLINSDMQSKAFKWTPFSNRSSFTLPAVKDKEIASTAQAEGPFHLIFSHDDYYVVNLTFPRAAEGVRISMPPDPRSFVFNEKEVRTYRFTVNEQDSLYMEENALLQNYVPANLQFEDQDWGQVGLRYKGSIGYSLPNCFDPDRSSNLHKSVCHKISLKIKFDQYNRDKRFYDMRRLNLHALSADPTKMHDILSYGLFRDMGVLGPRVSYVKIYINDNFEGLFLAVEEVDGRFAASRWPSNSNGNMYKEVWPTTDNPNHYIDALRSNRSEPDPNVQPMIDLYHAIEASTEETFAENVGKYLNFNHLLRYIAVDRAINDWDGIMGWYADQNLRWYGNHNFYFYQEEVEGGKIWLVPWDKDQTFRRSDPFIEDAGVPDWNEAPPTCSEAMPVWGGGGWVLPPNCDPLTRMLASVFWDDFVKIGHDFLHDLFSAERMIGKIDTYAQTIDDIIREDPVVDHSSWVSNVNSLKTTIHILRTKFENHLTGYKPVIDTTDYQNPFPGTSGHLQLDHLNNFEFTVDPNIRWAYSYESRNSFTEISHNTVNPISGDADFKLSFELHPSGHDSPWSEWCGAGLNFEEEANLSDVKEIHLSIRSDRQRSLRISVNSSERERLGAKEDYGWDATVNNQTRTIILQMNEIDYPSWGDPNNPDIVNEVISTANALAFSPGAQFDAAGELSRNPDIGYLQVDNIRFVK
ncbi:CotH kinase family protein [Chitinispirillales bacterium ANBcel5]|uniref:CotH kinase family protein n=1 Tax=Cellulosispirillum alkaliphilum TaxID=3039283 RepID=UPI002A580C6D|nr:CotH kinase family protein [Chitinispirillales bacterium ANBcel5]